MPDPDITPEQQQALWDEAAIYENDAADLTRAALEMTHAGFGEFASTLQGMAQESRTKAAQLMLQATGKQTSDHQE